MSKKNDIERYLRPSDARARSVQYKPRVTVFKIVTVRDYRVGTPAA